MKKNRTSDFLTIVSVFVFSICILIQAVIPSFAASSPATNEEIFLWPGVAPGSEGLNLSEIVKDESEDPKIQSRGITKIVKPSITVFMPEQKNGIAALVVPGGGYTQNVFDKEGTDIAKWLNNMGITAFVLKSRLPGEGHADAKHVPLQDSQRALRIIRSNAAQWGLNPQKVGVVGLSSGGHLASMIGTNYNKKVYVPVDPVDEESARPDFMVLAYPPVSTNARIPQNGLEKTPLSPLAKQELYDEYPTDLQITKDTPKTFIVTADDDPKVPSENAVRFYMGLKKVGIPAELHIFMNGGHGFAIRNAKGAVAAWPELCREWMIEIGLFK
jgi:acetyl esterase/lipase